MGGAHDTPPSSPLRGADDLADMEDVLVDDEGNVLREVATLEEGAPPEDDSDSDGAMGEEEGDMMAEDVPEDMSSLTLEGHKGSAFVCALSPTDGPRLAVTGGEDDCARVWNLDTGALLFTTSELKDSVTQVCFSHDGCLLAAGDMSGQLHVYRVPSWERCWQFELGADLTWLCWHGASAALLAGSEDGGCWLWRVPRGDTRLLPGHGTPITRAALLPDGTRLLAGYQDGSARLYNLRSGETLQQLSGGAAVSCVSAHPDNALLATGGIDGLLRLYNAGSGKQLAALPCCPNAGVPDPDPDPEGDGDGGLRTVEDALFSPGDGAMLATATCGGVLTIWDVSVQRSRHQLSDLPGISCLKWPVSSPHILYVGCLDGSVRSVDVRAGTVEQRLTSVNSSVLDLAVSADASVALAAMDDGKARMFRLKKAPDT